MNATWRAITWRQFGAAIDMLENALLVCPEAVWGDRIGQHEFWYLAYHTLFYLDFYLSESEVGFAPPAPYTLGELDPEGEMPDRVYTKTELHTYLVHGREKCRATIAALSDERANQRCGFGRREMSVAELLLYNLRHVQYHAAQLNLLLRQRTDSAPRWVGRIQVPLD